ncbi:MAG: CCA tRNA nucleotidyltransferase [Clostridia bacterium]|nr:CCA tRNA nucleotidyltransferase [Clostridia bacterium]
MRILLPEKVRFVLDTLTAAGYTAYAVGGCVRDSILGRTPGDWDITTSALPKQIKSVFPKTIDTGLAHGTVTVREGGESFEVTTYRIDGEYHDSRHPDSVTFTDNITEDLARRDFTINAMAYNEAAGLIDPFGGEADLKKGVIRCVGEPEKRFSEDALRMLRAVRFAAQLGFHVLPETAKAMEQAKEGICSVSAERIRDELSKTVLAEDCEQAFRILYGTGILDLILPELAELFRTSQNIKYHLYDVGTHTLLVTNHVPKTPALRFAALFHDLGKPEKRTVDEHFITHFKGHADVSLRLVENILKRLKFDNKTADKIKRLVKYHDREIVLTKKAVKRAVLDVGEDIFLDLLDLKRGDCMGQNPLHTSYRLALYDEIEQIYRECKADEEAFSLSDLALGGNDLIALGYQGKAIGILLSRLLDRVLEFPEENEKEALLKILEKNQKSWLENIE